MSATDNAFAEAEARLGTEIGVSNWITVDQQMINEFAETTKDDQWIHVDPERAAAETPFGGAIAHGFLTLSLASRFSYDCLPPLPGQVMGINYGFNSLRFLSPVLAVLMGWVLLGEEIGLAVWGALGLVSVGLIFINRK